MTLLFTVFLLAFAIWLLYVGRAWAAWVFPIAIGLCTWRLAAEQVGGLWWFFTIAFVVAFVLLGLAPVRRVLVSKQLMPLLAPIFPKMSKTETEALEAGTVWWDKELFSGKPNWDQLLDFKVEPMSAKERAFLDGPCTELCKRLDDWQIIQSDDLPADIWQFLKDEGFLGLIIPEAYGGLGFSAQANGAVVAMVSSRSVTAGVTVMVPNSLGPAELLLHYGTKEQKDHYLPRLAKGLEVPCFALTEPGAGSDAGAMTSHGVVCRGEYQGKEVLGIRLNWDKRYITLSAVATVIGLAFKLDDPDGLLGEEKHLGITCALIPAETPGVVTGKRHNPLGVPFINGPTQGVDVFVPIDFIIGGQANAGKGWKMLMQSLAAGRGISLPAQACGAAELTTRTVGAYATIREQFNTPIGKFEGIEERMGPIAGMTYMMEASRWLTAGAIDAGEKPAVITAICKAYMTEAMRKIVNDGMDIIGGSGISLGPRNILGRAYQGLPIGITVEGANILTRSMIIFGQGAIRCHAFALEEMMSVAARDARRFDAAFFGHIGGFMTSFVRATVLGICNARLAQSPVEGPTERHFQQFERMSAAYAVCSEICMMTLGGQLKRKEMLTGRLADGLAWMYLGTASLKRFVHDGDLERDEPMMHWSAEHAAYQAQCAMLGVLDNLPIRPLGWFLKMKLFPGFTRLKAPSDRTVQKAANAILDGGAARESLSPHLYIPAPGEPGLGALEANLAHVVAAKPVVKKLKAAMRAKTIPRGRVAGSIEAALEAGVINGEEGDLLRKAEEARWDAIQVDAF